MGFTHLQIERNPWVGGCRPQIPVLSALCPQLNLLTPPFRTKFLGTSLPGGCHSSSLVSALPVSCTHRVKRRGAQSRTRVHFYYRQAICSPENVPNWYLCILFPSFGRGISEDTRDLLLFLWTWKKCADVRTSECLPTSLLRCLWSGLRVPNHIRLAVLGSLYQRQRPCYYWMLVCGGHNESLVQKWCEECRAYSRNDTLTMTALMTGRNAMAIMLNREKVTWSVQKMIATDNCFHMKGQDEVR
jgi:hypothetical protein